MTSRSFLVEVAEDGTVVVGELRNVKRTISEFTPSFGRTTPAIRRIRLEATIVSTTVEENPGLDLPEVLPGSIL